MMRTGYYLMFLNYALCRGAHPTVTGLQVPDNVIFNEIEYKKCVPWIMQWFQTILLKNIFIGI